MGHQYNTTLNNASVHIFPSSNKVGVNHSLFSILKEAQIPIYDVRIVVSI